MTGGFGSSRLGEAVEAVVAAASAVVEVGAGEVAPFAVFGNIPVGGGV